MPRKSAENQKRYREKRKQDEAWLEKERKRQRDAYIPVAKLSESAKQQRRKKTRESMRKHRDKKKNLGQQQQQHVRFPPATNESESTEKPGCSHFCGDSIGQVSLEGSTCTRKINVYEMMTVM